MPSLTAGRAALVAGVVTALVFAGSLSNGWAFDDEPIISSNQTVHSVGAAAGAFFSPYWPEPQQAGQYRPGIIFSYAIDWWVSGGRPWWFHLVNVLLHGVATGLAVIVLARWLAPMTAAVAGVLFGVHPVHVEAVANVVGRAEIVVAVTLFVALLAARRYRAAAARRPRWWWLGLTVASVTCALLAKEHGVVAIALIAIDHWLESSGGWRKAAPLYTAIAALTGVWFFVWYGVAGSFVSGSLAATIDGLTPAQRLATMLPVQLDVVRLLGWPFDLVSDYNPQVLARRTEWSVAALLGLAVVAAGIALGFVTRRSHPAFAFAIWCGIVTYAPTSNLVFGSGVVLAERNLYLAALIPAVGVAAIVAWVGDTKRRPVAIAVAAVAVTALSWRSVTRVPDWRDSTTLVIQDFVTHPENYRSHLRLGTFMRANGQLPAALAEALTAGAIYPHDPGTTLFSIPRALQLGRVDVAAAEARRAVQLRPESPRYLRWLVRTLVAQGRIDSAMAAAAEFTSIRLGDPAAIGIYLMALEAASAPQWRLDLVMGAQAAASADPGTATRRLRGAIDELPDAAEMACLDLALGREVARSFAPELAPRFDAGQHRRCAS